MPPRRSNKDDPLDRIADLYDEAMDGVDELRATVRGLASKEELRALQEAMREHVEKKGTVQSEGLKDTLGYAVAGAKSDIMSEVNSLITGSLDKWATDKLEPLVARLIEEREKLRNEQRAAQVQKYRNWIVLATSAILFAATLWTTFSNNETDRDYTRAVERMDELVGN